MNPYQPTALDQPEDSLPLQRVFNFRPRWFVMAALFGVIVGYGAPFSMLKDTIADITGALQFFGTWGLVATLMAFVKLPTKRSKSKLLSDRLVRVVAGFIFGYFAVWLLHVDFLHAAGDSYFVVCSLLAAGTSAIVDYVLTRGIYSFTEA